MILAIHNLLYKAVAVAMLPWAVAFVVHETTERKLVKVITAPPAAVAKVILPSDVQTGLLTPQN